MTTSGPEGWTKNRIVEDGRRFFSIEHSIPSARVESNAAN